MTQRKAALLWLAFACAAPPAVALPLAMSGASAAVGLMGRPIVAIDVTGVEWGADLKRILPLRPGMPLTRDRLQRSIRAFDNWDDPTRQIDRVRAYVEPETLNGRSGVRIEFRVEPLRKITHVSFRDESPLETSTLLRAVDLPAGTEFWPDRVTQAAARVAKLYARQGWLETEVEWQALPDEQTVQLIFFVHKSAPTTLVRIQVSGNKGLSDSELLSSFDLKPGARLSLDAIDEGIVALKARYREHHFYRARIDSPVVETGFGHALVTIPVDAGPRFTIQVLGNSAVSDALLLDQLNYAGEEALDEGTQRDLAARLWTFYDSAGFPHATVEAVENTIHTPWTESPRVGLPVDSRIGPLPLVDVSPNVLTPEPSVEEHLVTFRIREGAPLRVVERKFTGDLIPEEPQVDMQRRIDAALDDAIPAILVESRDSALIRAARVGGSPGAATVTNPRVRPHEVFSTAGYKHACREIAQEYVQHGYLDAKVGPAVIDSESGGKATIVIPIESGPRYRVASVGHDGSSDLPPDVIQHAINIHAGEPFTYLSVEDTRKAILALFTGTGHVFATVDDEEKPSTSDPSRLGVMFHIHDGPVVKVSVIDVKGTGRTNARLVQQVLTLHDGEPITPEQTHDSSGNVLKLGVFTSASVEPVMPVEGIEPSTLPVVVRVQEKPGLSLDVTGGISIVDGPRVGSQFSASRFLGSNDTFIASIKLNIPIFRFCLFGVAGCPADQIQPKDFVERRITVGMIFPVFGQPGETPVDQRVDLIAENLLRPSYFLEKYSVLATLSGLGQKKWGPKDHPWLTLSPIFQLEVEDDQFQKTNTNAAYVETLSDQKALLLPEGQTAIASFRPALNLDARNNKLNPTAGWIASLAFDFAHDLNVPAMGSFPGLDLSQHAVSMISILLTGGGYIPLYRPRHVVLALSGRAGEIFAQTGTTVIGTKVFFLGGTASLRGFNEDEVIPQDVRPVLHQSIANCSALVSQVGCDATSIGLIGNTASYTSQGGTVVLAGRSELRFGILPDSLDGDVFLDAGNLWLAASQVSLRDPINDLRYGAGFGLRVPLPIGPAALDLGFNLNPDLALGESVVRLHFSVGL